MVNYSGWNAWYKAEVIRIETEEEEEKIESRKYVVRYCDGQEEETVTSSLISAIAEEVAGTAIEDEDVVRVADSTSSDDIVLDGVVSEGGIYDGNDVTSATKKNQLKSMKEKGLWTANCRYGIGLDNDTSSIEICDILGAVGKIYVASVAQTIDDGKMTETSYNTLIYENEMCLKDNNAEQISRMALRYLDDAFKLAASKDKIKLASVFLDIINQLENS